MLPSHGKSHILQRGFGRCRFRPGPSSVYSRYEEDGVVIRHWRRIHGKDGASVYCPDWNGLSFVSTARGHLPWLAHRATATPDARCPRGSRGVPPIAASVARTLANEPVGADFAMPETMPVTTLSRP